MLGQLLLFLLFMAVEKEVNRMAGRRLMKGATCYLFVAALSFTASLMLSVAQVARGLGPGESVTEAWLLREVVGSLVGAFILPVGAALHFRGAEGPSARANASHPGAWG